MKKHMLKETNDMRRLMGLKLLKEDFEETGVMGVDAPESAESLDKDEEDHGDVVNEDDVVGVDAPESKDELEKDEEDHGDVVNEDSEGEETYNYGEDEGADEHREDEMEDELHHDEEDMAPHDRIKAIEDHLEALKKDMGYDEDHEDRDEEGTHFAEGKKYRRILNTLTESQYRTLKNYLNKGKKYSNILNTLTESEHRTLKRFINEGPTSTPNVDVQKAEIKITDGDGDTLYAGRGYNAEDTSIKERFEANEIMTITIPGLMCESAMFNSSLPGASGGKMPAKCKGDEIMFNVSHFGTEKLQKETLSIKGNVEGGFTQLKINMIGSSVKGY